MTASIPPLRRRARSVSAEVAAHLEGLITRDELRAGDRLPPERELAADMNVSRSSLRQAMFELESKKLIERRQGRGSTVTETARRAGDLAEGLGELDIELGNAIEPRDLVEPRIAQLAALRAVDSNLLSLDGHHRIYEAVAAQDAPGAAAAMEQHLREVREVSGPAR